MRDEDGIITAITYDYNPEASNNPSELDALKARVIKLEEEMERIYDMFYSRTTTMNLIRR